MPTCSGVKRGHWSILAEMSQPGSRSQRLVSFRLSSRCVRRLLSVCRAAAASALPDLSSENDEKRVKIASAVRGIQPLIALLRLPSIAVQEEAAGALRNLSKTPEHKVAIASASAFGLSSRFASPSVGVLESAGALIHISANVENRVTIALAGGTAPLNAL